MILTILFSIQIGGTNPAAAQHMVYPAVLMNNGNLIPLQAVLLTSPKWRHNILTVCYFVAAVFRSLHVRKTYRH